MQEPTIAAIALAPIFGAVGVLIGIRTILGAILGSVGISMGLVAGGAMFVQLTQQSLGSTGALGALFVGGVAFLLFAMARADKRESAAATTRPN